MEGAPGGPMLEIDRVDIVRGRSEQPLVSLLALSQGLVRPFPLYKKDFGFHRSSPLRTSSLPAPRSGDLWFGLPGAGQRSYASSAVEDVSASPAPLCPTPPINPVRFMATPKGANRKKK